MGPQGTRTLAHFLVPSPPTSPMVNLNVNIRTCTRAYMPVLLDAASNTFYDGGLTALPWSANHNLSKVAQETYTCLTPGLVFSGMLTLECAMKYPFPWTHVLEVHMFNCDLVPNGSFGAFPMVYSTCVKIHGLLSFGK